jgi:hypothetical protein
MRRILKKPTRRIRIITAVKERKKLITRTNQKKLAT